MEFALDIFCAGDNWLSCGLLGRYLGKNWIAMNMPLRHSPITLDRGESRQEIFAPVIPSSNVLKKLFCRASARSAPNGKSWQWTLFERLKTTKLGKEYQSQQSLSFCVNFSISNERKESYLFVTRADKFEDKFALHFCTALLLGVLLPSQNVWQVLERYKTFANISQQLYLSPATI